MKKITPEEDEQMKKRTDKLLVLALVISISLVGCNYMYKHLGIKDDNVVENLCEDIIELKTGIRVDLTPSSKDEGFHIIPRDNEENN